MYRNGKANFKKAYKNSHAYKKAAYDSDSDGDPVSSEEEAKKKTIPEILKIKRGLFDWQNIEILSKTIKHDTHTFTQNDFDNFIIAATTSKSTSFIRKTHCEQSKASAIMTHMFTKFAPNDKQLNLIISCYSGSKSWNQHFMWLDVLLDRFRQQSCVSKIKIKKKLFVDIFKLLVKNNAKVSH